MRRKRIKENRSLVRAHIAILLVFAMLSLVPFMPTEITGSTILDVDTSESNATETIAEITISEANISINVSNETAEINITGLMQEMINETNVTEENATITNETANISEVNVTAENITNAAEEINIINITEVANITSQNITSITQQNATIVEEKLIQYQAVIGQPVKWKKTIKLENETNNLEVDLPKGAKVLSIKEIENNLSVDITKDIIPSTNSLTGFFLTGLAVFEEPNATSLVIDYPVQEVEIEYETEAPQLTEEEINSGKRITISSNTHYENILTFTSITEAQQDKIKLYWIVNGSRVSHQITDYSDTNNNGLIDQISWVTPSLSNATFEVIIEISKAQHLDENYTLIADVYNETRSLDNLWTAPIYHKQYLRVTFERNLTSDRDITIYVRNTQGTNTSVEVYHKGTNNQITTFPVITAEKYYKELLTGMNGSNDTFDLRIVDNDNNSSAYLEFDYIVDPADSTTCGDVTGSLTLTANVTSSGTCFNITVDSITLDCAGYGIIYGIINEGDGVTAIARSGITVQNCFIDDNTTTNARGVGVNFSGVTDSFIINNTIDTNGTNNNFGIKLFSSSRNQVVNNTVRTLGSGTDNYGINVVSSSRDNNISGNDVSTNGSSENYGIRISTDSDRNVVNSNTVATTGTSNNNFGIYVVTRADGNNITGNTINTSGQAAGSGTGYGIYLQTSANNTLVFNNTITTGVRKSNPNNIGLRAVSKSFFNNFTHNRVNTTGNANNYGVDLANNADISIIEYNNISTDGNSNSNYGIAQTTSTKNNITNNLISVGRAGLNVGIIVQTDSNNTIIDSNNITTNGTGASNFGIYLLTRSNSNNVTNNIINTTGTTTNHGIDIDTDSGNNLVLNNTINYGGSSSGNRGILLTTRAFFNNITHNRITNKGGTSANYGIELTTAANASTIEYNNISTNGTTTTNYGITITSSTGNNITNNIIFTNGSSSNEGIIITTNSNNTIVNSNNITTTGTGASNFGIDLISTAVANNITSNVINTSGTATNFGIFLSTNSDNSTIDRNNITAGGSSTANHGVYLVLNSSNNNVTNNVINASGSGTIYGLAVENITEGNSMNRFDSNNISISSAGSFGVFIRAANDTIFNNTYIRDVPNWTSSARGNNNNTFENTTFANINGTISFTGTFQLNGTRDITLALLNTTFNRSFVNSSNLTFLNTTATVRLYIPGLASPRVFLDTEDDTSYAVCQVGRCTIINYTASVLTFTVTGWTSHAGANNSAPTITRVDINSTDPATNNTDQNITIYPRNVTDSDRDRVFNITNWFKDGNSMTVLYLPFESNITDPSVSNTIRDYSGLGRNGTGTGGAPTLTWTNSTSARGGAYIYDGGGVHINVSPDSDLAFSGNQNWTVTFWMNGTATGQVTQDLISLYNGSSTDVWELAYQANFPANRTISFEVAGNTSSGPRVLWAASNSVPANRLHFIIAMWERVNSSSANMSLWVNGRTSSSTTTVINLSARSMELGIGGRPVNTRGFNGTLDEILIFNQSLSSQQIEILNSSQGDWLTIVSQETGSPGENWSACVTPNDVITDGTTVCSANFTVGNVGPNSTLNNPPNRTINVSSSHVFNSNFSDDTELVNATLYHNISGSWVANQTSTITGTTNSTNFSVSRITAGGYSWNVQVCDSYNACSQAPTNFTFTLNEGPNSTLNNPPNGTFNRSSSHRFNANFSDDRALENATLYHNISGSWVANQTNTLNGTSNSTNFSITSIVDGGYIWNVQVCDADSNCSQAPTNFTFTVDATFPTLNLSNPPNGTSNLSTSHVFLSNASDNYELANATLYHNINGTFAANETVTRNGTENSSNFSILNMPSGTYIWNVLWCDISNNCAFASSNFTFIVESPVGGGGGTGTPASLPYRTQTIYLPKPPKPVKLPEELEPPEELPPTPIPRFRLPKEVITKTIDLQVPLKMRAIDWTALLIILCIIAVVLIRKELQYFKEFRAETARLRKEAVKGKSHILGDIEITLSRSIRILAISLESIFTAFRFASYMLRRSRLKAMKLAALAKANYTRTLEQAKKKIVQKVIAERKLLALERARRRRLARLHRIRAAQLEIRSRIESIRTRLLSTARLTANEMYELEQSFRSAVPMLPELMPHPEVREISDYENHAAEFTQLYSKVDEYIKSNTLDKAKESYEALLSVYSKLLTETANVYEIISAAKEIQSRLLLAILATKARERIEPYKLRKIRLESEPLPPEARHDYARPPAEEEMQIDYLHQLLKKNEYRKAVELFNSIYPEARKKPLAWPEKIKLPKLEEIKPHLHPKEIPEHEEDLRFSYMRELLRKNEYKEALKLYESIYKEKRQLIKLPQKLAPVNIEEIELKSYPREYEIPTEEEVSIDNIKRLLKNNEYKKAIILYNQLYHEKRRFIASPKPIHGIKITEIDQIAYHEEALIKEDQRFALMHDLLKKNNYAAAKKLYNKLFNKLPHKNDK